MSKSNKFVILNDEWKIEIDSFNTHIPYNYREVKSKDTPEGGNEVG